MAEGQAPAPEAATEWERARLEGARLAARGIAHRVNNDLTGALGTLSVVLAGHPDLPADVRERLEQTTRYLRNATTHLQQCQAIVRLVTRNTPAGPILDVEGSLAPPQP